jgi:hypothetical protein
MTLQLTAISGGLNLDANVAILLFIDKDTPVGEKFFVP